MGAEYEVAIAIVDRSCPCSFYFCSTYVTYFEILMAIRYPFRDLTSLVHVF